MWTKEGCLIAEDERNKEESAEKMVYLKNSAFCYVVQLIILLLFHYICYRGQLIIKEGRWEIRCVDLRLQSFLWSLPFIWINSFNVVSAKFVF